MTDPTTSPNPQTPLHIDAPNYSGPERPFFG
jgi:hypothetical protein